jgi:exopolyphosphatase/guanosine-5'-triphosphate,3'-diphosphate pyrophosphatase
VQEHIRNKTGISVEVLSNAEQRFLGYKALASSGEQFERTIEKGTAIVDLSGGTVQISLFDKDNLITAQNLMLGSLRISSRLASFLGKTTHPDELIDQLIRKDILNYKRMYLKDRNIDTMILVGDYFTNLIFQNRSDANKLETREEFTAWYDRIITMTPRDLSIELGVDMEVANAVIPMAVLYNRIMNVFGVNEVWLPGIQLTDGIAYDYGMKTKLIKSAHDFDRDIVLAARRTAKRYASNKPHADLIVKVADEIFKAVRKDSVLTARDNILLKVACYMHDCGKYISLVNVAACSYDIIMSTEIIGLSDTERRIIANVVRYNTDPFEFYGENKSGLSEYDYLRVAQLTAILRVANSLDQSYLQKFTEVHAVKKNDRLTIEVSTTQEFTLEAGLFEENVDFFEGMFDIEPVLKVKRIV